MGLASLKEELVVQWTGLLWRGGLVVLLLATLAANGGAFLMAWRLTHFQPVMGGGPLDTLALARPENRLTPRAIGLEYQIHRIELANGDTLEGWYVSHPRPRGLVAMFHGHAGAKDNLLTQAQRLHELGLDLFMVDFRGSGGSSGTDTTIGLRESDDVLATVAYLKSRWAERPVILYGISMGSAAILRAMAQVDLQPAGLVLESTFDRLRTTVAHRVERMAFPAWPATEAVLWWGGIQHGVDTFSHNPAEYAATVSAPTLLLQGGRDPWIRPDESRTILDRLRGPKDLVIFPSAGHTGLLPNDPQRWHTAVATFLDQAIGSHR